MILREFRFVIFHSAPRNPENQKSHVFTLKTNYTKSDDDDHDLATIPLQLTSTNTVLANNKLILFMYQTVGTLQLKLRKSINQYKVKMASKTFNIIIYIGE